MKNNIIIRNAHIVSPQGKSARKGEQMGQLLSIEKGLIEITKGIIRYAGPASDYTEPADAASYEELDAQGCCVLPGFVDSHTHFIFGGERSEEFSWRLKGESYMSIMNKGGGIMNTVRATLALDRSDTHSQHTAQEYLALCY